MKCKQRILAIVLLCSTIVVMGIIQCFASSSTLEQFLINPDDIGNRITSNTFNITDNVMKKFYIKTTINTSGRTIRLCYSNQAYDFIRYIVNSSGASRAFQSYPLHSNFNSSGNYVCLIPIINIVLDNYSSTTYDIYIPVYCINCQPYLAYGDIELYESLTVDEDTIRQEAYNLGYLNGYNEGYGVGQDEGYINGINAGQELRQDLNIVEHIEQLIAQFTGNKYAKYITPIALVLTILMIYFLFIRFILSLMKAKGVIKTCDILMIVACIIILVAMYMPMINLEITQHQIIEQVETTSSDVYTLNSDVTYYTYTDDQGNTIHGGPVGTWIETVEETSP